jgi:hypothetical protein
MAAEPQVISDFFDFMLWLIRHTQWFAQRPHQVLGTEQRRSARRC